MAVPPHERHLPCVVNVTKEKMPQLNRPMPAPQAITSIHAQLTEISQKCELRSSEFAIVEDSVLLDGKELLGRKLDIAKVVRCFTEPYVGVTVVLSRLIQEESSLSKAIAAAGGSCYFLTEMESFDEVVELARARMQRANKNMADGGVADSSKNRRSPDELKGYCYSSEEQAALRKAYESDEQNGSVLS